MYDRIHLSCEFLEGMVFALKIELVHTSKLRVLLRGHYGSRVIFEYKILKGVIALTMIILFCAICGTGIVVISAAYYARMLSVSIARAGRQRLETPIFVRI
jgi:hypothetical protein